MLMSVGAPFLKSEEYLKGERVSDCDGNLEIYAMDLDGNNVTRLTNNLVNNLANDLDPYAALMSNPN